MDREPVVNTTKELQSRWVLSFVSVFIATEALELSWEFTRHVLTQNPPPFVIVIKISIEYYAIFACLFRLGLLTSD